MAKTVNPGRRLQREATGATRPQASQTPEVANATTVAEVYLRLLRARGIEYLFGNAGTDFAPIIEAFARSEAHAVPRPVVVPHENTAIAMAHGYHLATGKLPAVMLHVGLGTANAINGIYNASRQRAPMLVTAGRTPLTESGLAGSRDNFIHWAQEMFDQAGMLRELVKWDYELRHPMQLEAAVERAMAMALSAPRGPVYLTLPREILGMPAVGDRIDPVPRQIAATVPQPDPAAIAEAARWLGAARAPLIVTSDLFCDAVAVARLAELADRLGAPVVQYRPRELCLPYDHPCHAGFDPRPYVPEADLILVVEADVPWLPSQSTPAPACRIVHLGVDPLYRRYPLRSFRTDLAIEGETKTALALLAAGVGPIDRAARDARLGRIAALRDRKAETYRGELARASQERPISPAFLSRAIEEIRDDNKMIVVNEYPLVLEQMNFRRPGSYFSHSPAGGLGWGLGAALGAKLGAPEKTVIATVGDGAYMFGNPTPAHFVGRAMDLPVLYVIFNNSLWASVRRSVASMYPGGEAIRAAAPAFCSLEPSPDYEKIVEASGGYGERIDDPLRVPAALARALRIVREEKRQAVLNVIVRATAEQAT